MEYYVRDFYADLWSDSGFLRSGLLPLGKVRGTLFYLSSWMQRLNKPEVSGKKTILKVLFCNSHYQSHNLLLLHWCFQVMRNQKWNPTWPWCPAWSLPVLKGREESGFTKKKILCPWWIISGAASIVRNAFCSKRHKFDYYFLTNDAVGGLISSNH
jgi:hypothetical protein